MESEMPMIDSADEELIAVDDQIPKRSRSKRTRESTRIVRTREILHSVEAISRIRQENIQRRRDCYCPYHNTQSQQQSQSSSVQDDDKSGAKSFILALVSCVRRPPPRSPTSRWSSPSVDEKLDKIKADAECILAIYEEKAARSASD